MQNLMNKEKNRWKEILQSVVAVIKFLSKQNLPFRGHREDSNSRNQGNFLETLKLLANYSTVINEHIFGTHLSKKVMTTYLSPTIQNKLIELLGKKVKDLILEEIKTAKYFSILLDSTPNVSHIDQMAFIVRYVKIDSNNEVQIKESFLNFFPLHGKNADETAKSILNELQQNGLDIMMCRGQAYDNASTLAGVRTGVQRRIKDINSQASVARSVFPAFFQRRLVSFYYLLEALGKPASRRRLDARSLEFGTLDERSPASWSWKKENFEAREKGLITASHCNCSSLVWARAYITDNRCVPFTEGSRVKALFVNYRK